MDDKSNFLEYIWTSVREAEFRRAAELQVNTTVEEKLLQDEIHPDEKPEPTPNIRGCPVWSLNF
jgi:hypothetical protein